MVAALGVPFFDENLACRNLAFDWIGDGRRWAFPCGLPGARTAAARQAALPTTLTAAPGFRGATAGTTAIAEGVPEFSKFDLLFVEVAEPGGDVMHLIRYIPQKVEKDRFAIKQVLDVDQDRVNLLFFQEILTSLERAVPMALEPLKDQRVCRSGGPQQLALLLGFARLMGSIQIA